MPNLAEIVMPDAVIVSTARTPIGKAYRGAFNTTHGATLGGHVVKHAVERAGMSTLNEGQKVTFDIVADRQTGKSAAENLRAA